MSNEKTDIKNLNKEIISLKSNLKEINKDKEKWFKEKEDLKKDMHLLIDKAKELQKNKDSSELDKLKKERDNYNAQVKKLIQRIIEVKGEKRKLLEKHGIKEDPEKIKKDIEKMEEKIETEVLSVDKEKKMMDIIKRMKANYENLGGVKLMSDKIDEISNEIEDNKKKANDAHEKLKLALKDKKSWYRELFSVSKQINMIKKQQEKAFATFISFKNSFVDVSKQLSGKLSLAKKEKQKTDGKKQIDEDKRKERDSKIIEDKTKKVEEKLRKGGKLTTEDLIAMQGKDEELDK